MARELDAEDLEAGSMFFTISNIEKHIALFVRKPLLRWRVRFRKNIADDIIPDIIRKKNRTKVETTHIRNGPLRIWVRLPAGRPDQTKDYVFGIDLSKGQGASNSVISVKCVQSGEKIMEWRDANTPPYEMARIVVALALWCGGRRGLPLLKWEMNGPGWDFGRIVVKKYHYPFYYRDMKHGNVSDKATKKYGWHSSINAKFELLTEYDRALSNGTYFNPSEWGLNEAKMYVHYDSGGIGPACMVEENASARKTHGDVVIADALTIGEGKGARIKERKLKPSPGTVGYRIQMRKQAKKRPTGHRRVFDFGR